MRVRQASYFSYYKNLSRQLGYHLWLTSLLALIVAYLDGLSVVALLPVVFQFLQKGSGQAPAGGNRITDAINGWLLQIGIVPTMRVMLGLALGLLIAKAIFKFLFTIYQSYTGAQYTRVLTSQIGRLLGLVEYPKFLQFDTGTLSNVTTNEVNRCSAAFLGYTSMVSSGLSAIVALGISFLINKTLTFYTILFGLFLLFIFKFTNNMTRVLSRKITNQYSKLYGLLIQSIQSFKYIASTNRYVKLNAHTEDNLTRISKLAIEQGAVSGIASSFSEPLVFLFLVLLVNYEFQNEAQGSLATILILVVYFYRIIGQVILFQAGWNRFLASLGSMDIVYGLIDDLEAGQIRRGGIALSSDDRRIEFQNVSFSYGSKEVLTKISFTLEPNQLLAIVGESGSGKSTLLDLTTGLQKPASGKILVNGIDFATLDLDQYREQLGFVTQDAVLYNDSILNNVSFWAKEPNQTQLEKSLELSFASQFVGEKDGGVKSQVGDRGGLLSGGQKQRLAIAREIYKEPKLLIFDEATSALDPEAEAFVRKSIEALKGKTTIILVAHRLSMTKPCDKILVLKNGVVVEEGNFTKLHAAGGYFRKLCDQQEL